MEESVLCAGLGVVSYGYVYMYVHVRKKRKVSRVMGWLLSLQLREPGAGSCCAVSIFFPSLFLFSRLCARGETTGGRVGIPSRWVKMSFTWLSLGGRRVGHSAFKLVLVAAGAAGALQ